MVCSMRRALWCDKLTAPMNWWIVAIAWASLRLEILRSNRKRKEKVGLSECLQIWDCIRISVTYIRVSTSSQLIIFKLLSNSTLAPRFLERTQNHHYTLTTNLWLLRLYYLVTMKVTYIAAVAASALSVIHAGPSAYAACQSACSAALVTGPAGSGIYAACQAKCAPLLSYP